jgi:hypothetical protein
MASIVATIIDDSQISLFFELCSATLTAFEGHYSDNILFVLHGVRSVLLDLGVSILCDSTFVGRLDSLIDRIDSYEASYFDSVSDSSSDGNK